MKSEEVVCELLATEDRVPLPQSPLPHCQRCFAACVNRDPLAGGLSALDKVGRLTSVVRKTTRHDR